MAGINLIQCMFLDESTEQKWIGIDVEEVGDRVISENIIL